MSDPENDLPELELEPADPSPAATEPAADRVVSTAGALAPLGGAVSEGAPDDGGAEGQWVWQYAAPAPPRSFGAAFFSGTALPELYRFFACGLLVVLGCFLPWGPVSRELPNPALADDPGAPALIEQVLGVPDVIGVQTALGALSLAIGVWLVFSSCYGIYTRRQKILPVFLMLEPAIVSWLRVLDAYDTVGLDGGVIALLDSAGTGVLLTLIGSTLVSLQFLFVVGKVYAKKDDKGAARRGASGKGKDAKKDASKSKGDRAKGASRAKDDKTASPGATTPPAGEPVGDAATTGTN